MANIIFDWSGVISNDFDYCIDICNQILKRHNIPPLTKEYCQKEFTLPYINFYRKFIPDLTLEEHNRIFNLEAKNFPPPTIYPNVLETLKKLKEHHNLIILSSHIKEQLLKELESYQLQGIFQDINAGVHNKIESISEIMQRNKFNPEETYYVGDMIHDIHAGKSAKVKTIATTYGYSDEEKLKAENPDYIIHDIQELSFILNLHKKNYHSQG